MCFWGTRPLLSVSCIFSLNSHSSPERQVSLPAHLSGAHGPHLSEFKEGIPSSTLTFAHDCARGSLGFSEALQKGKDLSLVT